jgi:hypothetical protein
MRFFKGGEEAVTQLIGFEIALVVMLRREIETNLS